MIEKNKRIISYDVARALAVMAMVVVNYDAMMQVAHYAPPWLETGVNFIYGRAATVFVMLAGVSISLMSRRRCTPVAMQSLRKQLLKRSLLLLCAGLLLGLFWEADILHFYALYIAVGAGIMFWPERWLRRLAGVVTAVSIPVCAALTITFELYGDIAFLESLPLTGRFLAGYFTSTYYPVFPWFGFFLIGMLMGRHSLAPPSFHRRCLAAGLLVFLCIECLGLGAAASNWLQNSDLAFENEWLPVLFNLEAFPATPLFMISSGAGAVACISLLRLVRFHRMEGWIAPLAVFGQLSLTFYIGHLLLGTALMAWLSRNYPEISAGQMLSAALFFCLSGIVFAAVWRRRFPRGPIETVFHRLSQCHWGRSEVPSVPPEGMIHQT